MGARVYLGTLFEVGDTEAYEIIKRVFDKGFDRPLSVALWHAQNAVYGTSSRRPYVLSGPHFQRLRTIPGTKVGYLHRQLVELHNEYIRRLNSGEIPEKFIKEWKEHIEFFKREIKALRFERGNPEDRPSSARDQTNQLRLILEKD